MNIIRKINALICAPYIAITGNGFSSYHRHTDNLVYKLIDTVGANYYASKMMKRRNK